MRQLVELTTAEPVDPAVADVRDARGRRARKESGRRRGHAAQVARIGDGGGNPPVREAERGLETVGFEADARFERKRPGAVLVGARRVVDERLDGVHGLARRHLAGDMASHPVGDDEQSDVGSLAVAVLVAGTTQPLVRCDGPAERQRTRDAHGRLQPCVRTRLSAPVRGLSADAGRNLEAAQRLGESDARPFVVDFGSRTGEPCLGARGRGLGALDVDIFRALGQLRQDRDAVGQYLREAKGERHVRLLGPLAVPHLADRQRGEHRRVSRQDAEIPFGAWDLHFVHLLADHEPVGRDDLQIEMGRECHVCSSLILSVLSVLSAANPSSSRLFPRLPRSSRPCRTPAPASDHTCRRQSRGSFSRCRRWERTFQGTR